MKYEPTALRSNASASVLPSSKSVFPNVSPENSIALRKNLIVRSTDQLMSLPFHSVNVPNDTYSLRPSNSPSRISNV